MPQRKYTLTESGRRLLLERYDGRSGTIDALMEFFPGIPRWKIKQWASSLGLARMKEPAWAPAEVEYLETHLHRASMRSIAKHLGRTLTAVRVKSKRLDLKKSAEGYTMSALCLGLGVGHRLVERWVGLGWLKGTRRQTERERDLWFFSERAIRLMAEAPPQ